MGKMLASIGFVFAAIVGAVSSEEFCSPEERLSENIKKVGQANNHLALNLYRELSAGSEGNIFFSPFTLSSVLSILYHGAEGETAQELRQVLGYNRMKLDEAIFSTIHLYLTQFLDKIDPASYTISSATAVVADNSLKLLPDFKAKVQELYETYVQEANIAEDRVSVVNKLNSWVKAKTKGMIKYVVDSINPATTILLASAAYFKGSWRVKFDPEDTKFHPFYNGGRRSDISDVLMMHMCASFRYYDDDEDFKAVELSYEGKNMSLVIFLPETFDGLPEMEQYMTPGRMALVRRRMFYNKIHLTMPRFKLGFNRDLSNELQSLGLKKAFKFGADFSRMMAQASPLSLAEVRHKAVIDVNEKGSVAASLSTLIMTKMIPVYDTVPEFKVNHPFLFAIFDTRSGMILFMGRVYEFH